MWVHTSANLSSCFFATTADKSIRDDGNLPNVGRISMEIRSKKKKKKKCTLVMGGVMMSSRIPPGGRSLISAGPYRSRLPRRHLLLAFEKGHNIPKPEMKFAPEGVSGGCIPPTYMYLP